MSKGCSSSNSRAMAATGSALASRRASGCSRVSSNCCPAGHGCHRRTWYRTIAIDARPRGLPRRDISLDQALADFEDLPVFDSLRRTLVEAFVGSIQLSGFQVRAARGHHATGPPR